MKLKNSFIMHHDYWNWFKLLTDEELGKLVRALFLYEREQKDPTALDEKLSFTFNIIKDNLDHDRARYEAVCTKNKENARLRWKQIQETKGEE